MMWIAREKHELQQALAQRYKVRGSLKAFRTGVRVLDEAAPEGGFQRGAVHELLWPGAEDVPASVAMILAVGACGKAGALAWGDPRGELYLPALTAMGVRAERVVVLRAGKRLEQLWAMAECLRCPGVGATVGIVEKLNQIEARRLQLAAEKGGGIGILMRPHVPGISGIYAAATRWLVQAARGDQQTQRWSLQLLHGHGGQVGKVLLLEVNRETRQCSATHANVHNPSAHPFAASGAASRAIASLLPVHSSPTLGDRSPVPAAARASA